MKSFLQSEDWGKFQESLGKTVEINPVKIKHQLFWGFYYWYIPRVNVQVENNKLKAIKNSKCVFVRVEPDDEAYIPPGAKKTKNVQPGRTLILNLTKTEDELLSSMHTKTRYNIRLSEKHGIKFSELKTNEEIELGLNLICKTAKRQDYKDHGYDYYFKLLQYFGTNNKEIKASLFGAWHETDLLCVGLFIDFQGTRTYLFGGSSDIKKNLMAPYTLHWQAILEAKNQGIKLYDFWGIETASGLAPGFAKFKMGFGGEVVEYPGCYDIALRGVWYNIYCIIRKLGTGAKNFLR